MDLDFREQGEGHQFLGKNKKKLENKNKKNKKNENNRFRILFQYRILFINKVLLWFQNGKCSLSHQKAWLQLAYIKKKDSAMQGNQR